MLSVKEISKDETGFIAEYWQTADDAYLQAMGADRNKLPAKADMMQFLLQQIDLPYEKKQSYCIIWQVDNKPIGHSNVNQIIFGNQASMHLHLWNITERKKGMGTQLVKMSLPYFFENLKLKKLICEPYALNPVPNKTLAKAGFDFVRQYTTIPGAINFEQEVKRWEMSVEKFKII